MGAASLAQAIGLQLTLNLASAGVFAAAAATLLLHR